MESWNVLVPVSVLRLRISKCNSQSEDLPFQCLVHCLSLKTEHYCCTYILTGEWCCSTAWYSESGPKVTPRHYPYVEHIPSLLEASPQLPTCFYFLRSDHKDDQEFNVCLINICRTNLIRSETYNNVTKIHYCSRLGLTEYNYFLGHSSQ